MTEVLTALATGGIILGATGTVLITAQRSATETDDRVEATQRARLAVDRVVRLLNSQVCLTASTPPVVPGSTNTSITFYSDVNDDVDFTPLQYRFTYDAPNKRIVEDRWVGTATNGTTTFSALPTSTSVLATQIVPRTGVSMFRYFAYTNGSASTPTDELTTFPLSAADAVRVVRVSVALGALPARVQAQSALGTSIEGDGYVSTADPRDPNGGPRCSGGA